MRCVARSATAMAAPQRNGLCAHSAGPRTEALSAPCSPGARRAAQVNTFQQVNDFLAVPDLAPAIVPPEYVPQEDLTSWLLDAKARDQYALRWADNTEIYWNDPTVAKLEPTCARHAAATSLCAPPPAWQPPPSHARAAPPLVAASCELCTPRPPRWR